MTGCTPIPKPAATGGCDLPWLVVKAGSGLFALNSRHVQEIVSTPPVSSVPSVPPFVRGVINLRGQVMPLADLRRRLGMESLAEATARLVGLLTEREQDHRRWVDELTACVRERRAFALTTDPHACKFGKWYDTFKTDNLLLENILGRFDEPHRRIHAVGQQVVDMMAHGEYAGCEELVERLSATTLQSLVKLFAEARLLLNESNREVAVVVRGAGPTFAVAVDAIEAVERFGAETFSIVEETLIGAAGDCVDAVARRPRDGALVLTLDAGHLLRPAA